MRFEVRLANKLLNRFLKKTLSIYLIKRFNIKYDDVSIRGLKPPFIIVANHQTNWDPFILSYKVEEPVHFVTSIQQFRTPIMRFLLGLAGSIPKTKSMSDAQAVRGILKIRKLKGVIGVFPEGMRGWDGKTEKILYPTAKMLKQMKIPVVSVLFQGGYLSHPRWARKSRKGEIQLKYDVLISEKDIEHLTVDEIYVRVSEALETNDYDWQKRRMIPFKGRKLAESLELSLFLCPECKGVGKLKSEDDTLTCTCCGEKTRYNEMGYFEKDNGNPRFHTVYEWNQWQLAELDEIIKDSINHPDKIIFEDKGIAIYTAEDFGPLKKVGNGILRMMSDRIEYITEKGRRIIYSFDRLNGVSTHLSNRFDFYYDGIFYCVKFRNRHISANKWSEAYNRIQLRMSGEVPERLVH